MTRFIHFPANPDKFEFDAEVTSIFDDMAVRSIPLYEETHRLAIEIVAREYHQAVTENRILRVLDIGASTGTFFKGLWKRLGYKVHEDIPNLRAVAVDNSYYMCETLRMSLPMVDVQQRSVEGVRELVDHDLKFDAVIALYVFQFIPLAHHKRLSALIEAYCCMADTSLMILANKEKMSDSSEEVYCNLYREFRMQNGYTVQEIDAKTRALSNSMWTQPGGEFKMWLVDTGFDRIDELCRWLQFATYIVYKRQYHG